MAPKRRGRRSGRRRCRRGARMTGAGPFWKNVGNFLKRGISSIGRAFMKDPAKYINGAKNIYNSLKGNTTNGLTRRRRKGRTGSGPRGRGRRVCRRCRRDAGLWDSIARRSN